MDAPCGPERVDMNVWRLRVSKGLQGNGRLVGAVLQYEVPDEMPQRLREQILAQLEAEDE